MAGAIDDGVRNPTHEMNRMTPPHLRGLLRAAALVAGVAVAVLAAWLPATASAQPLYYVTIDQESVSGGPSNSGPVNRRVSPRLPDGARLEGGIRCSEVRVPGPNGTSTNRRPTELDAGYYQIATESCRQNPNSPLRIEGAPGTVRVLGGIETVKRGRTVMDGASAVSTGSDRVVVLTAALAAIDIGDGAPLPGRRVQFLYETFQGQRLPPSCEGVTALDDDGNAVATCTLRGEEVDDFFAGTGYWQATFEGTDRLEGSTTSGVVEGAATSFEQAAINYQNFRKSEINVIKVDLPPSCHRFDAFNTTLLLSVSLSALDCDQLRALQIATKVVLTVTTVVISVNAPTGLITTFLQKGAVAKAEALVKAYDLAQLAQDAASTGAKFTGL